MSGEKITINRALVGVLALVCLGVALAIWIGVPDGLNTWMWVGAFTRVGVVMSAFWLALPSRHREAAWADVSPMTFAGILVALIAAASRPRVVIPILAVVAVLWFVLRPRPKQRPSARPDHRS